MITYLSPKRGYERQLYRSAFNTANPSRLPNNFRAVNGNAEALNKMDRDKLRGVARNLENNSDIAESILSAFDRNIIGTGMTLQIKTDNDATNQKVEQLFKEWSSPKNCDVTQRLSFCDIQSMLLRRLIVDGGILIKKIVDAKKKIPFRLQLIEVDELDTTATANVSGNFCYDGIEVSAVGVPQSYHLIQRDKYGNRVGTVVVPAEQIIDLKQLKRPTQIREVSQLARNGGRISDTDEYLESTSVKQRIMACLGVFIKKAKPTAAVGRATTPNVSNAGHQVKKLEPGMIGELQQGEDVCVVSPNGQATDTEQFIRIQQRLLSAGMGVSYESVARDLSQVNYSSARQNLLEDRATYKRMQKYLIEHFCEEVFEQFLQALRLRGLIENGIEIIPHAWVGSGWNWIDPLKEVKADDASINGNLSTLQQVCAERGLDWKEVLQQRAKELETMRELGIIEQLTVEEAEENVAGEESGEKSQEPTEEPIAKISLNGAQIQSLLQIVTAVAENKLEYEAGIELIIQAFPFEVETAKIILGNPSKLAVEEEKSNETEEEEEENGGTEEP